MRFSLFILFLTLSVQQMYDTLAPRSAVNPATLFVLWQRLETPALFSQSIYPPVKLLSRCWRLSGGSRAPSCLYWTGSQGSVGTLRLIDCTFLCLSTNTFFSFVSLSIPQMPDCSGNFCFTSRTAALLRSCALLSIGD